MDGEVIYNIINDFYTDDTLLVSEDMKLKEVFGEGSECSRLSEKMYQAKKTFYFVYPKPAIFVPDTKKYP